MTTPLKLSPTQEAIVQHLQAYCEGEHYSPGAWICIPEGGGNQLRSYRALQKKGVIEFSEDGAHVALCGYDLFVRLLPPFAPRKRVTHRVHHLVLEDDDFETLQRVLADVDMYYEMVIQNRKADPRYDEEPVVEARRDAQRLRACLK